MHKANRTRHCPTNTNRLLLLVGAILLLSLPMAKLQANHTSATTGESDRANAEESRKGTVVKISKTYDNHTVSEGYRNDIDRVQRSRQADQSTAEPREKVKSSEPISGGARHSYWHEDAIYFSDIETHLYHDHDRDGFYTGFNLYFDVDSEYGSRWVYARIYLREEGDVYRFLHETHVFEIYDDNWDDGYEVETDLVANYDAGYYDVRIELYESGDAEPWDVIDASNFSSLRALPLESETYNDGPQSEHIHEYSGSVTLYSLLALGLLVAMRRTV